MKRRTPRSPLPTLAMAAVLSAATVTGAPRTARAAEAVTPERLAHDLEQGARLFRQGPDSASAQAYSQRLSWIDVEWDGTTITVRDPWLADATASLDRLSPELRKRQLEAIADHLAARATQVDTVLEEAAADPGAAGEETAAAPEELLDDILEQKRYQAPPEDPKLAHAAARFRDTVRSAWKSVKDFVADVFRPREGGGVLETIRRLGLMGLAVLTVALIGWLVARALMRAAVDTAVEEPETEMPEAPPQPAEMAAEAKSRVHSGDNRGAIRALYLALLGRLHQQGVIVYDRHRTNREYLRAMRAGAARKAAFAALVEVFDRKWYGKEACSREEVEAFERDTLLAGDRDADRSAA